MPGFLETALDFVGRMLGYSDPEDRAKRTPPLSAEERAAQDAFLAAIREAPLDDAPRLIYADWLDERGGPERVARARYIRDSCDLARRWLEDGAPEDDLHHDRLLAEWGDAWNAEFPAPHSVFERHWRRGFPEMIDSEWTPDAATLAASVWPVLAAWHVGEFQPADRERFYRLTLSPVLDHLVELSLSGPGVDDVVAQLFADAPCLARLEFLGLLHGRLGDLGVEAIARSHFFPTLRSLLIGGCGLHDDHAATLLTAPKREQFSCLDLGGNHLTDATIATLVEASNARGLKSLELDGLDAFGNRFTSDGIRRLASWPGLAGLKTLSLAGCGLDDAAAFALADSPFVGELKRLDLSGNAITEAGRRALVESSRLRLPPPSPDRNAGLWIDVPGTRVTWTQRLYARLTARGTDAASAVRP